MNIFKRKIVYVCLILCYYALHKNNFRRSGRVAIVSTKDVTQKVKEHKNTGSPETVSASMETSPTDETPNELSYASLVLLVIVGIIVATVILTLSALMSVIIMLTIGHGVVYIYNTYFFPIDGEDQVIAEAEQINSMVGQTVGEYSCLRILGRGRYGITYLGSSRDRKAVAMKVVPKGIVPDFIILREWMALCLAKEVPFVVQCLERLETATSHVFVMEYVSGLTLMTLLRSLGRSLEEDRVRFYTSEIVTALSHLHKEGILLRDLRLENVMLDSQGHVKLIDMGSSAIGVYGSGRRLDDFRGTLVCIAPEVLLHHLYGHPADLWALGIIFCELLLNTHPFMRSQELLTMRAITRDLLQMEAGELSLEATDITLRLLYKEPETRLTLPEVKNHEFFNSVDWDLVAARGTVPPRLPRSISRRLTVPAI